MSHRASTGRVEEPRVLSTGRKESEDMTDKKKGKATARKPLSNVRSDNGKRTWKCRDQKPTPIADGTVEKRVRIRMVELGLGVEELAAKLNVSRPTIWGWVRGNPTLRSLERLSDALGVSLLWLITPIEKAA